MGNNILAVLQLKNKWNREKETYQNQEVGSGVQMFVKDILQCKYVFALKKGLKSTPLENRENEFLEEEKTKEQRRADIVIYISSDIVIPVEIEKYRNIEAGTKQLLNYQADLDKKYGILTDGFVWRFYNNNIFREFNLNQILDETELFLEFWKEYIKPEFYYLLFFEPFGQLRLIKQEKLIVEENRQMFFEDITKLIRGFKNKLQVEGYFNALDKKTKTKMAVEITYAYIIQFILYKTLVDNDFGSFRKQFEDIVEAIHKSLKKKGYKDILGIIDSISAEISKNIYRPFTKEQEFINQKLLQLYRSVENKLSDISPWLDIFVFIKKYNFANIENEIFGYIYENYLKELYAEEKKGQYFTDPAVVNFMLQQVGFNSKEIKNRYKADKNSISLIDPACGSGTFLYSTINQIIKAFGNHSEEKSNQIKEIVNNNIFGLDIEEFPIYLAEMNILMRMLPLIVTEKYNNPVDKKIKVFLTKDSIAEFMDTGLRNTCHDMKVSGGQLSLNFKELDLGYKSYVREETDLEEMKKSLESHPQIPRRRFDYVIGNPPYVGYNECSKQGALIVKLIQNKKVQMSDIYGVNLNTVPGRIKAYAPKPNLYAFFIALGIALLKDNGKLCYIIPQTILTAGDLDVIRYHLSKFTTIEKIIIFSGQMFIGRGLKQNKPIPTSSLIFVLSRKIPSDIHNIEIINYKNPDDSIQEALQNILSGKNINKKKVLQKKLLQNTANWNFIKQDKKTLDFFDHYNNNKTFDIYRIPEISKSEFNSVFYFDKGLVFPKNKILPISSLPNKRYFYLTKAEKNKYQLSLNGMIILESDLIFPKGSQGIKVYDKKYKVVWSYMNPNKFYFTDKNIMINFNWILISSDNRYEMLYILSLLNSKLNKFVFNKLLKNENEKDTLVGIKTIKEFARIPKITKNNEKTKEEIIKTMEEILDLEEKKLSDFVDFSRVMLQKFDKVSIEGNDLILEKEDKRIKLTVQENQGLVKKILNEKYGKKLIELEEQKIALSELKDLPIIDYGKWQKIKEYIDDMVFSLYFHIELKTIGINQSKAINAKCSQNPYYELVSRHSLSKL